MAKTNKKPLKTSIDKGALSEQWDIFIDRCNEYDARTASKFLRQKLGDKAIAAGTMVVTARSQQTRKMALALDLMDAIITDGKQGIGDPRKGDMSSYTKDLVDTLESFNKLIGEVEAVMNKAIGNNIGPEWAIRGHAENYFRETYSLSASQAEKMYQKFRNEVGQNNDLTLETFGSREAEKAQASGKELKEYLLSQNQNNQTDAVSKKQEKASKKDKGSSAPQDTVTIAAGANESTIVVGSGSSVPSQNGKLAEDSTKPKQGEEETSKK